MKIKEMSGDYNISLLVDELLSQIPNIQSGEHPIVQFVGERPLINLTLFFNDAVSEEDVDNVLAAHNPNRQTEEEVKRNEDRRVLSDLGNKKIVNILGSIDQLVSEIDSDTNIISQVDKQIDPQSVVADTLLKMLTRQREILDLQQRMVKALSVLSDRFNK
ncbi:MAG: hypothetical protein CUN55_00575 [Phototrophicales bacterium]|nr:MAG: hypothetical protein CUN55_00575 [Phototrophicales bacterium]